MFNNIHSKGLFVLFPSEIKTFLIVFVVVLSIGFFTGLLFINETTEATPSGIQANYMGNEDNEEATVMKFKKNRARNVNYSSYSYFIVVFCFLFIGNVSLVLQTAKKAEIIFNSRAICFGIVNFWRYLCYVDWWFYG